MTRRWLQRLLTGWWAAARRREASWQERQELAHLRWVQAVVAAEKADQEEDDY
jgi:hypothetical protein